MPGSRGVLVSLTLLFGLTLACEPPPRVASIVLRLPDALGCRPTDVDRVEVTALGDFPASSMNVLSFDPGASLDPIDRFPDDTRLLAIEATGSIGSEPWVAGGVAAVRAGEVVVPLLRLGRACPLADPGARVPDGAAVAALADGRLWIAGGDDGRAAQSRVVTLRPGESLAVASSVRLFVDRTRATATALGDLVVVAGGSASADGAGEDTFEVVNVASDERAGEGFLLVPRREHAAIALADGRIVLSGGRATADGVPMGDVELLTIDEDGVSGTSVSAGVLAAPRAAHGMFALDDGTIAIAGGVGPDGRGIALVERFDPTSGVLELMGAFGRAREEAAFVALPGARVARIGGRDAEAWSGDVEVLLDDGEEVVLEDAIPPLERPVAAAAPGGLVIVIGRDPVDGRARGVLLDPDTPRFERIEASRAATALVALADGSFAEVDALGLSLLRVGVSTPLHPPPASITPVFMDDREALALDAAARWRAREGVLEAQVSGARFDVPSLRFAQVDVALDASGAVDLLLVTDTSAPIAVSLTQEGASIGECRVTRNDAAPLRVRRAANTVTLEGGRGSVDCPVELPERIGIAVRAREEGAGVRRLEIVRR